MKNQLLTRSSDGFTLIEILIVIFIIGILSAIAVPSWLAFVNTYRLNAAQNQVYLAIREAQSNAKRDKVTWQASFREMDEVVQWAVHPITLEPAKASWNDLDSHIRLDPESTLQLSDGVRQIKFDYRGNVRKPPFGRITLSTKDGGSAKRCVFVSTILGAMRTAKEHRKPKDGKYCY